MTEQDSGVDPASAALDVPAPPVGGSRRRVAARGVVINSVFLIALGTLNLVRTFAVASFLSPAEFGVWSVLFLALIFFGAIKVVAVGDKYIQQDEEDQERAFQKAFTLELLSAGVLMVLMCLSAPVLALAYGQSELLLPGLVISLLLPGLALQAPVWIFYRRMDFLRQRLLLAVDPVVSFVVTIGLAAAGLGYWSLIWGIIAGAWAAGAVALVFSPYRPALRYEHTTMREYLSFSWPLMLAVAAGVMIGQLSVFFGELALGLAGAGAIGLAAAYAAYTDRIDSVITQALYPAICRVREKRDLLFEAFVKSNRLALMWAVPFGIGLTLFASDLIEFGIGEQWRETVVLLQVYGLAAAINHIGFNWGAFYRASGITRPLAVVAGAGLATFAATAIPLLFVLGLDGFAVGIAAMTVVSLIARWHYIRQLFANIGVARHFVRAIAPTLPAAAVVLAMRLGVEGTRSLGGALSELAVYLVVSLLATIVLERALLREAFSYLRPSGTRALRPV